MANRESSLDVFQSTVRCFERGTLYSDMLKLGSRVSDENVNFYVDLADKGSLSWDEFVKSGDSYAVKHNSDYQDLLSRIQALRIAA